MHGQNHIKSKWKKVKGLEKKGGGRKEKEKSQQKENKNMWEGSRGRKKRKGHSGS